MAHYVCPQCGGVAETPKTCGTEGCKRQGQPLAECTCGDGQHAEVTSSEEPAEQAE